MLYKSRYKSLVDILYVIFIENGYNVSMLNKACPIYRFIKIYSLLEDVNGIIKVFKDIIRLNVLHLNTKHASIYYEMFYSLKFFYTNNLDYFYLIYDNLNLIEAGDGLYFLLFSSLRYLRPTFGFVTNQIVHKVFNDYIQTQNPNPFIIYQGLNIMTDFRMRLTIQQESILIQLYPY